MKARISVIIPALNEEPIGAVVRACLRTGLSDEVIVVDNASSDATAARAREAGARVITARRGYGRACAAGAAAADSASEILVFLDGDGSDCPESMDPLVRPIVHDEADFVIGSRVRGEREPGSMNFQQVFAGRVAGYLLWLLYGVSFTDMCPFRAIRRRALDRLGCAKRPTVGISRCRCGRHGRDCGSSRFPSTIVAALAANQKFRGHCGGHFLPVRGFS